MDLIKELEYPLPVLNVSIDKIELHSSKSFEGTFEITNKGGQILFGNILSNSKAITFSPEEFKGNFITVKYNVDLSIYSVSDVLVSSAIIMSNGGQENINIKVTMVPHSLFTKDGVQINNLKEFYIYATKKPIDARVMFASQDFMVWLFSIGFEKMEIYDYFVNDSNKERGLDNFLIVNKLKQKTSIKCLENRLDYRIEPFSDVIIEGVSKVEKSDIGYVKTNILVKNSSTWLKLLTKSLSYTDFLESNVKEIKFNIDTNLIKKDVVSDKIILEQYNEEITINVYKKHLVNVKLSKNKFSFDDSGILNIENNSGKDILVEIIPKDAFIKFEGKKYFISKLTEIPFKIKFTGLQLAQITLKKLLTISTQVVVKATVNDKVIINKININLGDLK